MSSKHTPGPWRWLGGAVGVAWEGQGGEAHQLIPVAMLANPSDGMEPLEWHANAMLIAAAPDLLQAAKDLKEVCNRPSAARTRAYAWKALDKAIKKAEGR